MGPLETLGPVLLLPIQRCPPDTGNLDGGRGLAVITVHRPVTEPDTPNTLASTSLKGQGVPQRPAESDGASFLILRKAGTERRQLDCGAATEISQTPETAPLAVLALDSTGICCESL